MAAVAEDVDDDIVVKALTEFGGHAADMHHRFRIVAIDVKNRRLDDLCRVRRVGRGAGKARAGGEADLIVDDDVNRAAGAVAPEVGKLERFRHHALAGEGRIAVNEDAHRYFALLVTDLHLLGPHLTQHHRVDRFEMRRVGREREMDLLAIRQFAVG